MNQRHAPVHPAGGDLNRIWSFRWPPQSDRKQSGPGKTLKDFCWRAEGHEPSRANGCCFSQMMIWLPHFPADINNYLVLNSIKTYYFRRKWTPSLNTTWESTWDAPVCRKRWFGVFAELRLQIIKEVQRPDAAGCQDIEGPAYKCLSVVACWAIERSLVISPGRDKQTRRTGVSTCASAHFTWYLLLCWGSKKNNSSTIAARPPWRPESVNLTSRALRPTQQHYGYTEMLLGGKQRSHFHSENNTGSQLIGLRVKHLGSLLKMIFYQRICFKSDDNNATLHI